MSPSDRAVEANDRMLEFKNALARYRLADGLHNMSLIVRMNVGLKPAVIALGISYEIITPEITHLGPVRVHAVDHVRACRNEGTITLLARA